MNVVYKSYENKMIIAAPVSVDQFVVTATNAVIKRQGDLYTCIPTSYSNVDIDIVISAKVDEKIIPVGKETFRVMDLPNPTVFFKFNDVNGNAVLYNPEFSNTKLTRYNLTSANIVAEYADSVLQAKFKVQSFVLYVPDGQGGFTKIYSDGNNFSRAQKEYIAKLKAGTMIFLGEIKITGTKTATLSFPPIELPE